MTDTEDEKLIEAMARAEDEYADEMKRLEASEHKARQAYEECEKKCAALREERDRMAAVLEKTADELESFVRDQYEGTSVLYENLAMVRTARHVLNATEAHTEAKPDPAVYGRGKYENDDTSG
jgi:hypothetical protein